MIAPREWMRRLAELIADEAAPPSGRRVIKNAPPNGLQQVAGSGAEPNLEFGERESESQVQFTREQRRSRRKRPVRARSISTLRLARSELEAGRREYPEEGPPRPRLREECRGEPRPCPYVSCRYHLYLDVSPKTGSIKLNFPDLEVWELDESCSLDVAERGGVTAEDLGALLNVTRERIRQVELRALISLHGDLMKTA